MTDKTSVADWSTTASENDNVGGIDLRENVMRPRDVNNAIRTVMAQIKSETQDRLVGVAEDRDALRAMDGTDYQVVNLTEPGREGQFLWDRSDLSAVVRPLVGTTTAVAATKSINGYSASNVCTLAAHGLYTGCPVTPTTSVNGLTAGTTYYVIKYGVDDFALATTRANAYAFTSFALTGTTNFTLNRIADPGEGAFLIPTGKAVDGSEGAFRRVPNYALAHPDLMSVMHFGATGDGTTDDSEAIINAATLMNTGYFKRLFFPAGTYWSDTTGNMLHFDHITGGKLVGDGWWAAQIKFGDNSGARPFRLAYADGFEIDNIYFNSDGRVSDTGHTVWDNLSVANCKHTTVNGCKIEGADFYGLGGYGDVLFPNSALYIQEAMDDFHVTDNFFLDCGAGTNGTPGYGVEIFPNVKSVGLSITDNLFMNCGGLTGGVGTAACKGGSAYELGLIARNKIYNSPASGIHCGTHESIKITDNDILDWGQEGSGATVAAIAISLNTHPFYGSPSVALTEIKRNSMRQVTAGSNTCYGISVNGSITTGGPVYVDENTIVGARGLLLRSTDAVPHVKIRRNTNIGLGTTDLFIFGDATAGAALPGMEISGNKVESLVTNRTTTSFINLSGFTDALISENEFIKGGNIDIQLTNCGGSIIEGNKHIEPNVSNTSSTAIVNVSDTNSTVYTLQNNEVFKGDNGNPKAYYTGNSGNPTVRSRGNRSDTLIPLQLNSTPNLGGDWMDVPCPEFQTVSINGGVNLIPFSSAPTVLHTGTLTADRTVTLTTTNAVAGKTKFRITRTGSGAFNLNVGSGPLVALAQNEWCEVTYDGSAYVLTAFGSLS